MAEAQGKSKIGKIIAYTVGGIAVAVGGYFGWDFFVKKEENGKSKFQNKKDKSDSKDETEVKKEEEKKKDESSGGGGGYTPPSVAVGFPLNANEHNKNVPSMQNALIKMGFAISGAPSDYLGKNTLSALTKAGYTTPVSKADYDAIIAGKIKVKDSPPSTTGYKWNEKLYLKSDSNLFTYPKIETKYFARDDEGTAYRVIVSKNVFGYFDKQASSKDWIVVRVTMRNRISDASKGFTTNKYYIPRSFVTNVEP